MWEYRRHKWESLRSAASARDIPETIERLRLAATEEEASNAYWRIDNEVIIQGALFEAALPTAMCLVTWQDQRFSSFYSRSEMASRTGLRLKLVTSISR